jgi:dipeptidyl-peptidase-4
MKMSPYARRTIRLWGWIVAIGICLLCLGVPPAPAQAGSADPKVTRANYRLAARFTANGLRSMVKDTTVRPVWLDGGRRFWYALRSGTAIQFFVVDFESRSRTEIAVELRPVGPNLIEFTIAGSDYRFDTVTQELTTLDPKRYLYQAWEIPSPDGSLAAFAVGDNLAIRSVGNPGHMRQLTHDGEPLYSFREPSDPFYTVEAPQGGDSLKAAQVFWSPDSRRLVATRLDIRHYRDLWVINSTGGPRPELVTYKQRFPGDDPPTQEVWLYDSVTDSLSLIALDKWKPSIYEDFVWSRDSKSLYGVRKSPDKLECDLLRIDAATCESEVLLTESPGGMVLTRPVIELPEGAGFLWWSRRDGYGHYYHYTSDGELKEALTSGGFNVARALGVSRKHGALLFTANGRERGSNPYYEHFYRVDLGGRGIKLLTPEDAHHEVYVSPSFDCFVDNYSRVDAPAKAVLRDMDGYPLLELEATDISSLIDAGWRAPEVFKATAADGRTDLWGVMWKPYDFNPDLEYPIISFVYPGPQDELVPLTFIEGLDNNAHLAQYGFIVIQVGNRGGSYKRSLEYSEYYRGNLRDYPVEDNKAVIEHLASRHDYIDIDRVGIWGGSSGAYMAVTAMLTYPDFYKVCVARSGPHDPSIYHAWWSDEFQGMSRETSDDGSTRWVTTQAGSNLELAGRLKGRLLLIHSEMDQNVHPAHSARMARALMAANKRFDYFVVPGAGHGWGQNWQYVQHMIWIYFVRHLMGDERWDVDMFEDFED